MGLVCNEYPLAPNIGSHLLPLSGKKQKEKAEGLVDDSINDEIN
jgi:hypothetical protein